jgi:DNA-binding NarL/FixJ family response regulator
MKKIRIVLADDHDLVRKGVAALLSLFDDFEVVGQATNGEEAVAKVKELSPDVVVLDLEMPKMSGVEAAGIIRSQFPLTKILILSGFENEKYVKQILKSGAGGYVIKTVDKNELAEAIRTVYEGKRFFSPSISRIMVEGLLRKHEAELREAARSRIAMTDAEMEILSYLTQGLTMAQVGERLSIPKSAVEKQYNALKKKLDIYDVMNLVQFARDNGFIPLEV